MPIAPTEREVVELIASTCGIVLDAERVFFDGEGHVLKLDVSGAGLTHLPAEIGLLSHLRELSLRDNALTALPVEIASLEQLESLDLMGNPSLLTPPAEIVAQGPKSVLHFFRELHASGTMRYEAKVLVVGEGGTGKTSLVRSLRQESFVPNLASTHGIEISNVTLPHPHLQQQNLFLHMWDFGGQQVYHATHQFFLTRRSIYLLVWNARLRVEQSNLDYWLNIIRALAPDSPVLVIATHIDEAVPDLNYRHYNMQFPQIAGWLGVSNRTGEGIVELREKIAEVAIRSPLTGQIWPKKWIDVENALWDRSEAYLILSQYLDCCQANGVTADIAQGTLASYLHDVGKILYFRDDVILSNFVILRPDFVTKAISRVLEDEPTRRAYGILTHTDLPRIWNRDDSGHPYDSRLFPVFLRLMERFELSYQLEPNISRISQSSHSLIPQLLPFIPPENLSSWQQTLPTASAHVEIRYRFDFLPAGLMSRFIVRTHRYTQNLHWREGVALEYEGHRALVEMNPMLKEIRMAVWGIQPSNFLAILMATIDLILSRYEGLQIEREIPCICHTLRESTEPCPRSYRYEDLVRRAEAGRWIIECPESFMNVHVAQLLYGIHSVTTELVVEGINEGKRRLQQEMQIDDMRTLLGKINQNAEIIWRSFHRQWNLESARMEAECPIMFLLTSNEKPPFDSERWMSHEYQLHLLCQYPSHPHLVQGEYPVRQDIAWWTTLYPWLNLLIAALKLGVPLVSDAEEGFVPSEADQLRTGLRLMEQISKNLIPTFGDVGPTDHDNASLITGGREVTSALRALHTYLETIDPAQIWGGLKKTLTPDGMILWLCDEHLQLYDIPSLKL